MYSDLADYYLRWYHERPVGISSKRRDELRRLHTILYKCVEHLALHYEDYVPRWMPLDERELQLLEWQRSFPFRAGTWRPDYLISADGALKLCEITSRFFAHGIFMSWFAERAADLFLARFPDARRDSRHGELLAYMCGLPGPRKRIYVFKSADRTNEIRLYKRFYEAQGCQVQVLETEEVDARRSEWAHGAFLISALNQHDLLQLEDETILRMLEQGLASDLRNVFLIHDKRFMRLWFEDTFTNACLTPEETTFLRTHAIPTYVCADGGAVVRDAAGHKNDYILKPWRLGKSQGVSAGPLTDEATWQALWESGRTDTMVLQPFLRQRNFPVVWEGKSFDDYLCGMMLCVDDRYFDSGMFRASSLPVTNVGDDRKACALHTDDPQLLKLCDVL